MTLLYPFKNKKRGETWKTVHSILMIPEGKITEKTAGGGKQVEGGEDYSVRKEGRVLDPKR